MSTKFKSIVIDIHLNNILKSLKNAPKRCINRLIDLGCEVTSNPRIVNERAKLEAILQDLIRKNNIEEIKQWFKDTFLN